LLIFLCEIAFLYPIDLVEGHATELTHLISLAQWAAHLDSDLESLVRSPAFATRRFFGFVTSAHWVFEFESV
jgi:hypothetical protein